MNKNLNYLFQYLEKEDIKIDKTEFLFQVQSHPDYPTILAIKDTLSFFNIENGIFRLKVADVRLLPKSYVAVLKEQNEINSKPSQTTSLYYIEQKKGFYFCTKDKKCKITQSELESRWEGILLLVEKAEYKNHFADTKEFIYILVLTIIIIILFTATLFLFAGNIKSKLFFIFPMIGILFSIAALKDLFGTKSKIINSFCNITPSSRCTTIVNSEKWKIFKYLNYSDLSIVFFTSQFIGLLSFVFSNDVTSFFLIQKASLLLSIPIVIISLYYQKLIEKTWCPICLAIIGVTISEMIYLVLFVNNKFNISFKSLILYGFVSSTMFLSWFVLKRTLITQKKLKEFQLEGNQFMRNYEVFRSTLVSKSRVELPNSPIILGNKDSDTEISIITSPFCGHCESIHKILEKILTANKDNLKIKTFINADIDDLDKEKKVFFRSLLSIYLEKGDIFFLEALNYWFETKNLKDWIKRYELPFDSKQIDSIYRQQNKWCKNNDFNFTPIVFINGYQYPKTYRRENLTFFVNELIEDNL